MNNIEAAFVGKVTSEPESKIAASGNAYLRLNIAVGEGEALQYVNVAVFKDEAAKLSGKVIKGSRVYCEGRLKLDRWEKDGEKRSGLSLAAWRCDLLGQIGQNKPPRGESKQSFPPLPEGRERRGVVGRDDFDRDSRWQ
jgi:single-strand DNA-binding protein